MRDTILSYLRLVVASWLFVGGLAVQFWPSVPDGARIAGVVLGGIGFAVALHETAYVVARFNRGKDLT